jgi:beta-aspartyl-peptidase (threonine type)
MNKLKAIGGDGGIVALDKEGHISMTFNTAGMYRGFVTSEGEKEVLIYQDK